MAAAVLGALLPDALDRTLHLILRVTHRSHHIGHTPLSVAALTVVAVAFVNPNFAGRFAFSYLTHLVTDDLHHGRVPWLLPFSAWTRLPQARGRARLRNWLVGLALEFPSAWILYQLYGRPKSNTPPH